MSNIMIGGYFGHNPWQRGTSFAAVAHQQYTADRFSYEKSGTMVHTISQSANIPIMVTPTYDSAPVYRSSLLIDCTTADATIAAGDYCNLAYKIEGYDFNFLAQRNFSLRFFVYATKTGTYCVAFRNAGRDRSYVVEYTVTAANTWEEKTISITTPPTAGTWDYTNGIGLDVSWALDAGTTFQTATTGSWIAGDFMATANQVNGSDSILNNFYIEGVEVRSSGTVTDIASERAEASHAISETIARCQRYYQKSYNQGVDPGTATTVGANTHINALANVLTGANRLFPVEMRATPTMAWYSTVTGAVANIRNTTGAADVGITGTSAAGMTSTGIPTVAAIAADQDIQYHWTATAEL